MNDYTKQLEAEIEALKGKLSECDWKAELFDRIMTSASIKNHELDFTKSIELEMICDTDNRLDRTIIEIARKAKDDRKKWWAALRDNQNPNTEKFNDDVEDLKKYSKVLREQIYKDIL